jgi:hypothetical protein
MEQFILCCVDQRTPSESQARRPGNVRLVYFLLLFPAQHQHNTNTMFTLRPEIAIEWLRPDRVSLNRNARKLLEQNPHLMDWDAMSSNPSMVHLLAMNPDKINWRELATNENAYDLMMLHEGKISFTNIWLNENPDIIRYALDNANYADDEDDDDDDDIKVDWFQLCTNPVAFPMVNWGIHFENIDWAGMSWNPHPGAIALLMAYPHRIDWSVLSKNKGAIGLLTANQHRIDWDNLSNNPAAIGLLTANQHRINWTNLSGNPAAIGLLTANQDLIDWEEISWNPEAMDLILANLDKASKYRLGQNTSIFTYDYQA